MGHRRGHEPGAAALNTVRAAETSPAAPPTTARAGPVPELDGVRGLAILLVLTCHFDLIQSPPSMGPLRLFPLRDLLFLGWSGVDLFFVLSGFLITGILLDTRESKNYFSSFYIRRALRVLPLYFLAVVGYFHLILPFGRQFGLRLSNATEPWFWLHLSNWGLAYHHTERNWLDHFWSLGVEEQFYLFWPLVVFYSRPNRLVSVCLSCLAVSFGLRLAYGHTHPANTAFLYLLTPFRIEPLAWGSLAAAVTRAGPNLQLLTERRILGGAAIAGLVGVAAAVWSGRSVDHDSLPLATYGYTAFALLYVCLVTYAYVASGTPEWLASQLRRPGLRSWGKYSYAIYVFHMPVLKVWTTLYQRGVGAVPDRWKILVWLAAMLAGFGSTYAVSLVSWHSIEKHFLRLKVRFAAQ